MSLLIQVDVGYACFGVEVRGGYVVRAAPIARWMVGKPERNCATWVLLKGGTWTPVESAVPYAG